MRDVIMLALVIISFAAAYGYARLCDALLGPPEETTGRVVL